MDASFPAGVLPLEHTADIGLEIQAPSLEALFHRAALGTMALLGEAASVPGRSGTSAEVGPGSRHLVLQSGDVAQLLVRWLRELLYLHDVHGLVYRAARFDRLDTAGLDATVSGGPRSGSAVGELKAVTYHGLEVAPTSDGWRARVIFDI